MEQFVLDKKDEVDTAEGKCSISCGYRGILIINIYGVSIAGGIVGKFSEVVAPVCGPLHLISVRRMACLHQQIDVTPFKHLWHIVWICNKCL